GDRGLCARDRPEPCGSQEVKRSGVVYRRSGDQELLTGDEGSPVIREGADDEAVACRNPGTWSLVFGVQPGAVAAGVSMRRAGGRRVASGGATERVLEAVHHPGLSRLRP